MCNMDSAMACLSKERIVFSYNITYKYQNQMVEYSIGNGQLSDVTCSAHEMGRYLANAIVSDKSE